VCHLAAEKLAACVFQTNNVAHNRLNSKLKKRKPGAGRFLGWSMERKKCNFTGSVDFINGCK
jgi:hypothetical protein